MDDTSLAPGRPTLTPAVLAAALFAVACAVVAIGFVAARGGLEMPVAADASAVAGASIGPTQPPALTTPGATPAPTAAASAAPEPTATPAVPTPAPSEPPTASRPTLEPGDPLLDLPGCPDLPGCFEYTIRRGDTLSGIASRYVISTLTVLALNPELIDPRTIVVGEILYLGRDPFVRLEPCPDSPDCSLYVVQPGDRLSTIAGRYGLTLDAVLDANPAITDPNAIYSAQVIRLPRPEA